MKTERLNREGAGGCAGARKAQHKHIKAHQSMGMGKWPGKHSLSASRFKDVAERVWDGQRGLA